MTTIRDVARVIQIAPSTVSFVLRPQTRERVTAAVQSLGYKPRGNGRPRHRWAIQTAAVIDAKYFQPTAPLTESAAGRRDLPGARRPGHDHVRLSAIRRATAGQGREHEWDRNRKWRQARVSC